MDNNIDVLSDDTLDWMEVMNSRSEPIRYENVEHETVEHETVEHENVEHEIEKTFVVKLSDYL